MKKSTLLIIILIVLSIFVLTFTSLDKISGLAAALVPKCYDSDKGNEPFLKGLINQETVLQNKVYEDKCINSKKLKEYYCKKNNVRSIAHKCTNGCDSGACIKN